MLVTSGQDPITVDSSRQKLLRWSLNQKSMVQNLWSVSKSDEIQAPTRMCHVDLRRRSVHLRVSVLPYLLSSSTRMYRCCRYIPQPRQIVDSGIQVCCRRTDEWEEGMANWQLLHEIRRFQEIRYKLPQDPKHSRRRQIIPRL